MCGVNVWGGVSGRCECGVGGEIRMQDYRRASRRWVEELRKRILCTEYSTYVCRPDMCTCTDHKVYLVRCTHRL